MRGLILKAIKVNAVLVLLAAVPLAFAHKIGFSAGLLVSAGWATVNLLLIANILEIALLQRSPKKLLLLLLIKFPVLYLLGFLILASGAFPALSLLLGISSILPVLGVLNIWPKRTKLNTSCPT